MPTLGLLVGVSVCRALRGLLPEDNADKVLLKWPNDVVVVDPSVPEGFAKICGISLEGDASGVCIGIGVNVIRPADSQASERKQAYMEELASGGTLSAKQVADEVLSELARAYDGWRCSGFVPFAKEYEELNIMRSGSIDVEVGESIISGEFAGVDEAGRMLLRTDSGMHAVSSGDAHVRGLA